MQESSKNTGIEPSTSLLGGYRNADIFGIFRLDSSEGDEAVLADPKALMSFLEGAGISPGATRYQVEFLTPASPFSACFYRLLGVKILPGPVQDVGCGSVPGNGETSILDFITQFMDRQREELAIERGCGLIFPISKKEGDTLIIAVTNPDMFAISAS